MMSAAFFRAGAARVARNDTPLHAAAAATTATSHQDRFFASKSDGKNAKNKNGCGNGGKSKFRPRRRPDSRYRPVQPGFKRNYDKMFKASDKTVFELGNVPNPKNELEATYGPVGAAMIEETRRDRKRLLENPFDYDDGTEEDLRSMDYFLSVPGTTEDLVGKRKAMAADFATEAERQANLDLMRSEFDTQRLIEFGIDPASLARLDQGRVITPMTKLAGGEHFGQSNDPAVYLDPNQLAFGPWSEMLVTVERTVKLWRGGRLDSYRALVIGGNMNGCGGFGKGKAKEAMDAVSVASRLCKRNIFFCERHQGDRLSRDLVGKQNNTRVMIRRTKNGLRGNELAREILMRFGILHAVIKAHGRRNPYNVVQATFKALMTHESLEEVAMKRGRRLVSVDRASRMEI